MVTTSDGWQVRDVYIDETSQTKHRYLLLGGITLLAENAELIEKTIHRARLPELPAGEMGWKKISRSKRDAYERVVELFFNGVWAQLAQFHCLVVDTHQQDHRRFNEGSREAGFCKEIYQIVQKYRRLYQGCMFHVYPDKRDTPQPTEELRLILNRGAHKTSDQRPWPFRRVHFRKSHDSQILQLSDILLGAVAYAHNGHIIAPNASPAKSHICNQVLNLAGINDVFVDTPISGKFTIWHRRLQN